MRTFLKAILPGRANFFYWLQAAIMLTGLLWWGWDPFYVVMAYFFETILVGIIHVVKMILVLRYSPVQRQARAAHPHDDMLHMGTILFFLAHYFFFVAIQSVFVFAFFQKALPPGAEPFHILHNYGWLLRQPAFILLVAIQAFTLTGVAIRQWWLPGKYATYTLRTMFAQPYLRIVVQQFVAILAGFFFIVFQQGLAAALLVVVLRMVVDAGMQALGSQPALRRGVVQYLQKNDALSRKEVEEQVEAMLDA